MRYTYIDVQETRETREERGGSYGDVSCRWTIPRFVGILELKTKCFS